ncbi:MAG TPA: four helix bundle protein [Acidobacteriota bacterium]|nr:four helix bundle protein [Acidobacteriota bacterium]
MGRHERLIVFKKADELAFDKYKLTRSFPKDEMFGLTSQLRRVALSKPTNIVEGYARRSNKELLYFINIALGSLAETEYLLSFSRKTGYVTGDTESIETLMEEAGKLLWGFYKKIQ